MIDLSKKTYEELFEILSNSLPGSEEFEKAKMLIGRIQQDTNNIQTARLIQVTEGNAKSSNGLSLVAISIAAVSFFIKFSGTDGSIHYISSHVEQFKFIYLVVALFFVYWQGVLYYKWHPMSITKNRHWREILLNSLGSLIGWGAGYFLIFYRINWSLTTFEPRLSDLIIFLIAFYGMNGELPNVLINKLKLGAGG